MNQLEIQNFARLKLIEHINTHKEPEVIIKFTFIGNNFKFTENISIFGSIKYKKINFDTQSAIRVIPNNLYYSNFDFIKEKHKTTPIKCHGFGDNWATEIHIYTFKRK